MTNLEILLLICFGLFCAAFGAVVGAKTTTTTNERKLMKTMDDVLLELQNANIRITTLTGSVVSLTSTLTTVAGETNGQKAAIEELKRLLEQQGSVSPEVEAELEKLSAGLSATETALQDARNLATQIDEAVPNVPTPAPTPTPAPGDGAGDPSPTPTGDAAPIAT